jgi:hypothetical protein
MTTTDRDIALDDLDRGIVLFVHRYRQEHGRGPLWNEVRDELGIPRPDKSTDALLAWWDAQPPDRYATTTAARRAFKRAVHDADPFRRRMLALRWAGYVRFSDKERSLDIGRRVQAWQARKATA